MRDVTARVSRTRGLQGCGALLLSPLLMLAPVAGAAVIDSDLMITGSVQFATPDASFPNAGTSDGDVTQNGDIHLTSGGGLSSGAFSTMPGGAPDGIDDGTTAFPATNPLGASMTDTGDGIGYATSVTAGPFAGDESSALFYGYQAGVRLNMAFQNNSATDTFGITMRVQFDNSADADGGNAFAEVELDLGLTVGAGPRQQQVLSDLLSDALFGDIENGSNLMSSGALLMDGADFTFMFSLAPGSTAVIDGLPRWKGGVYSNGLDPDGEASLVGSVFDLTISEVSCSGPTCGSTQPPLPPNPGPTGMPVPSSFWLFGLGLAGLALRWSQRRNHC